VNIHREHPALARPSFADAIAKAKPMLGLKVMRWSGGWSLPSSTRTGGWAPSAERLVAPLFTRASKRYGPSFCLPLYWRDWI
jgi:hypothetical protein